MSSARINGLRRSVGFRIALLHSAIFVSGSILVFTVAFLLLRRSIDDQIRDSIEFRQRQFSSEYIRSGLKGLIDLANLRHGRLQQAYFLRLADAKNQTQFLRDPEDWAEFTPERLSHSPEPEAAQWIDIRSPDGDTLRIESRRLPDGYILQVGRTLEDRDAVLESFRLTLVAIGILVIAAGAIGGCIVAFRALRPVRHLTGVVGAILDTGQFNVRVPHRQEGDEIDELIGCFNSMLERIDGLIRGMRESLDNVAHDLRTPMTHLRNVATTAIERDLDKDGCIAALGECLEESDRVMTMLSTLMDISEAETGVMKLDQQPLALESLIKRVVDLYEDVAETRSIQLETDVLRELRLSGDWGRLQRALGNLLDNALKYTPEGGRVIIRGYSQNGSICIEVADNGPGIPQEELSRIWDRLYRVDKSRSMRGLGLGLSFVKAIVEAHHGHVAVESAPGKGSRFTMLLPARESVDGLRTPTPSAGDSVLH